MTRFPRFLWLLLLAFAVCAAGVFACSGAGGGSGIPPVTGIIVRAETLTEGRGCGRAPRQIYKYAVVVFGRDADNKPTDVVVGNVYDCFADGTFVELRPVNGSFDYYLEVYAYNERSFTPVASTVVAAGTDVQRLRATNPTWTTKCTATQQPDVQSLALCNPLVPGLAGVGVGQSPQTEITLGTDQFPLAGGRTAFCGSTPVKDAGVTPDAAPEGGASDGGALEAGSDAEAGTSSDAGGPAPSDAGATSAVAFRTAKIGWRTTSPARIGPTIDVVCPSLYRVSVDAEPAGYMLDVRLFDDQGEFVGTSSCSVETQPGSTSTAVCGPP